MIQAEHHVKKQQPLQPAELNELQPLLMHRSDHNLNSDELLKEYSNTHGSEQVGHHDK